MISTRKLAVVAMGLMASLVACDDDGTKPPPPDPPAQIEYIRQYVRSGNCLPSGDVYAFLAVSTGEFWVGTQAGVARFEDLGTTTRGADDLVNEITGLPHPQVRSMAEYSGKVYVGTWGGGLGIYDIGGDAWTQIRPGAKGLRDGFIAGIAVSPTEDRLYMASNDGVFIYNPAAGTFTHFSTVDDDLDPEDFETPRLQSVRSSVEVLEDGGVVQRWYGPRVEVRLPSAQRKYHGIIVSKSATTYKYTMTNSGLSEPNVNDLYFDAVDNTVWVAYATKGVSEVDFTNRTWVDYTLVEGLPSNTVYAITRAKDNTSNGSVIWAATQNGLAKLSGSRWASYGVGGGLPSDRVRSLYSDDGDNLWVGFVEAGAIRVH